MRILVSCLIPLAKSLRFLLKRQSPTSSALYDKIELNRKTNETLEAMAKAASAPQQKDLIIRLVLALLEDQDSP